MMRRFSLTLLAILITYSCFAQESFRISHGPYLQNLNDTGVTIVWTTSQEAIAWVELAPDDTSHFYLKERPRYFSTLNGIKKVATIHSVKIEGLKPGTSYRYRIYSREVKDHQGFRVQYGNTVASDVFRQKPYKFTTSDESVQNLAFLMLNDIHGRNEVMTSLLRTGDWKKSDLIFFNGDMMSDFRSEDQMFSAFMDSAVSVFAKEKPMYYARGNHETRGQFAGEFDKYFPGAGGHLYYLLRQGPVCFVVLDCGEDKPDSDIEYSDITAYEEYRTKEAEWLKGALQEKSFREAPFKIAVIHMPPFGGWFGEQEVATKFLPLLNDAGIQVMLCGHLHSYVHKQPQAGFSNFPIIANSNNSVVKAVTDGKNLQIQVINTKGEMIDKMTLSLK